MGMSTAGLVLCLSSGGRTQRSAPTRRGSLSGMRFNDGKADIIFGRNLEMLERSSVIQAAIRRGEARLLLETAGELFGAPSQDVVDKVKQAKSKKLVEWAVRLRTAQSWTELIAD